MNIVNFNIYTFSNFQDMTFNDIHGCTGCLLVNTEKRVSLFFDMTKSSEDIQKATGLFAHISCAVTTYI